MGACDFPESEDVRVIVGLAGDCHLTEPDGDLPPVQLIEEDEGLLHGTADIFPVGLLIGVFDIQQHPVGHIQQGVYPVVKEASGGVKAGMNPVFMAEEEQFTDKFRLQKGFPARDRHAAVFAEVVPAPENPGENIGGFIFPSA